LPPLTSSLVLLLVLVQLPPRSTLFPYTTLFRSSLTLEDVLEIVHLEKPVGMIVQYGGQTPLKLARELEANGVPIIGTSPESIDVDRKSTRLNSSHVSISYAVFCLKKKINSTCEN